MATRPTKQFLHQTYSQQGLSTWAIEKKFGISRSTTYSLLKKYQIPIRSIARAHIKYPRSDFSGDLQEKAYLLGFSIGDLRVRSHNGRQSETISIACGSTKPAQIELIEGLFSKYGRVWKGKPDKRNVVNIEAFVNKSFTFLLPEKRTYLWCNKRKLFLSFLAGFTDAEGSFYISNGKAFVAWGNYDVIILRFIKKQLAKYGIVTPRINSDSLQGYVGSHGYARNKNYAHLTCSRKQTVRVLLRELKPFLKHADKKNKLASLDMNLKIRK